MSKKEKKSSSKAWKNVHVFDSYVEADQKRKSILSNDGVEVKVRRSADGRFTVKLRKKEELLENKKSKAKK